MTKTMTKANIVERVYKEADFTKKEAAELIDILFETIKKTLAKGEKVKISGFGNFSLRDKAARIGRNPQTGDSMEISSRRVLTFKPSQVLKEDITNRYAHRIDHQGLEDTSLPPKDFTPKALSSFHLNAEEKNAHNTR